MRGWKAARSRFALVIGSVMTMLTLVSLSAFPLPSFQEDERKKLEDAVWAKLKKEKLDDVVVEVTVSSGEKGDQVVTLKGKPKNAYLKMKAIEATLSVQGVSAVEPDLQVASGESSKDFAKDLVNQVLTYPHYTVFDDINFALEDQGVVTLGGYVTMPFKKDDLEERVGKVTGVQELKSEIQVLPASPSDDRLRDILFERIYGADLFAGYAHRANPPIHIIVSGGNVILTGAVRSNVEKRQAESIVRSTFGVFRVTNRLAVSP
jgi:osmotically-inducible protein OsmY